MEPKYPHICIELVGQDGNAFSILGRVSREMRHAGLTSEQIEEYRKDAMVGDYNHLLATTMRYVVVE